MRFMPLIPPRVFEAGFEDKVSISDYGRLHLDADEQITFTTPQGSEYDLCRKEWGFYATPSTNSRLKTMGLRTLLTRNRQNRCFVLLVEAGKEESMFAYLAKENMDILCWLDENESVNHLAGALGHAART